MNWKQFCGIVSGKTNGKAFDFGHWQYKLRNQRIIKVVGGSGCLMNSPNSLLVREPTWETRFNLLLYHWEPNSYHTAQRHNIISGVRDSLRGARRTAHTLQESALPTNPTALAMNSSVWFLPGRRGLCPKSLPATKSPMCVWAWVLFKRKWLFWIREKRRSPRAPTSYLCDQVKNLFCISKNTVLAPWIAFCTQARSWTK